MKFVHYHTDWLTDPLPANTKAPLQVGTRPWGCLIKSSGADFNLKFHHQNPQIGQSARTYKALYSNVIQSDEGL